MLPLLKRKKAAATCTLSLTNVSVHRSIVPFPSSDTPDIFLTLPDTSQSRQRTNASLLRRKRCALQSPQSTTTTSPRKRARKACLSSLSAQKYTLPSLTGDLMFLCNVYRSIAWTRLTREFATAEKRLFDAGPSSMSMDVDMDIRREDLDEQETVFMDRLKSYLIFHEINPQWLDVTSHSTSWVDGMNIVNDRQDPSSSALAPTPPLLPTNPQPQVIASLLFRHRHRVKLGNSSAKSRLLAEVAHADHYGRKRRTIPRSPLVNVVVL